MTLLNTITKPDKRPPILTLCGEAGQGKSSMAAAFPNPVFIRAEDGVGRISHKLDTPMAFPPVTSEQMIIDQLMALLNEDHDFKTVVIDSVTELESIFSAQIIKNGGKNGEPASSIATAYGGYGAGYKTLAAMHGRVRKGAGMLNLRKGMNVVFIAHAEIETVSMPDLDDYGRFSIRMHKDSKSHYLDNVDLVGFVRLQRALRGDDDATRKKIISNGDREFVCHATASSVSKNGLSITEPLEFEEGTNPLAPYLWPVVEEKVSGRRRKVVEEDVGDEQS